MESRSDTMSWLYIAGSCAEKKVMSIPAAGMHSSWPQFDGAEPEQKQLVFLVRISFTICSRRQVCSIDTLVPFPQALIRSGLFRHR